MTAGILVSPLVPADVRALDYDHASDRLARLDRKLALTGLDDAEWRERQALNQHLLNLTRRAYDPGYPGDGLNYAAALTARFPLAHVERRPKRSMDHVYGRDGKLRTEIRYEEED